MTGCHRRNEMNFYNMDKHEMPYSNQKSLNDISRKTLVNIYVMSESQRVRIMPGKDGQFFV
jgi:hypothetical protein